MINVQVEIDRSLCFFTDHRFQTGPLAISFKKDRSVKDLLESVGIPHVETGRILLDGAAVSPDFIIRADCCLRVSAVDNQRSVKTLGFPVHFILDVHLGKLAVNLRMLGLSVDYSNNRDDPELAALAACEPGLSGGILLSCDRGLLMRRKVGCGMVIRSREPLEQTVEVLKRYNLEKEIYPFTRCFNCGALLEHAGGFSKLSSEELARVPQKVKGWCEDFSRCTGCGQLYWEGSHFDNMLLKIKRILTAAGYQQRSAEIDPG